jgi:hypothetical protein
MKIFGREPALIISTISAVLSLIVTFNIGMSGEQAGAIVAIISAVFGAIVAAETVGATNAVVLAVLALLTRGQVSPKGVAA